MGAMMPQFSLRTVFLFVLLLSVALASIVSASEGVNHGLRIVLLWLPLLASCAAAYAHGSRRAFWIGVAVFAFWSNHSLPQNRWFNDPLQKQLKRVMGPPIARLHSSRIEREAYEHLHRYNQFSALTFDEIKDQDPVKWGEIVRMKDNNLQNQTGYLGKTCIQLFVALLGGGLIAWIHGFGKRRDLTQSAPHQSGVVAHDVF